MRKFMFLLLLLVLSTAPGFAQDLVSSPELHTFAVGYAGQKSDTYRCFEDALRKGPAARKLFEECLERGTPAARLYGAIGLYALDETAGREAIRNLTSDKNKVTLFSGCLKSEHEVGELARDLLGQGDNRYIHFESFKLTD